MNLKRKYRMCSGKCKDEPDENRFFFPAVGQTDLWREREENPEKRHTLLFP